MADAFIGEIRLFAGSYAPLGWAFCNGQLMSITQNTTLYAILGTTYGGDGKTNFALPNLQGQVPMGVGAGTTTLTERALGKTVGSTTVTLLETQIPSHNHPPQAMATPTTATTSPTNAYWAKGPMISPPLPARPLNLYAPDDASAHVQMAPTALTPAGNSQPHNNMQPYLALNFIICVSDGVFPAHN